MPNPSLILKAYPVKFITKDGDLDTQVEPRTLRLPGAIFNKALGLAEALNTHFRVRPRQYFSAESTAFAETLTDWLSNLESLSLLPRSRRITSLDQLRSFFAIPGNRRWLDKLITFAAESKGFTVEG